MADVFTAPWYPWYVNDVLTSERVELMSLAEEGAYRRALDRAWKKGSIPADPAQCARAIGKRCSVKIAKAVLTMFHPMAGDPTRAIHDRLEEVREEQRQKYLITSAKGRAGAEKRWHSHSPAIARAMPNQWQSESDTDREPKKEEERREEHTPEFPPGLAPSPFEHAAVKLFDAQFDVKCRSNFAKEVASRVTDFAVWEQLLRDKIAYADKPLEDRRKVANWILIEYDKRVKEKQNGTTSKYKSEREKSAERGQNVESFADALERRASELEQGGASVAPCVPALVSGDDSDRSEDSQSGKHAFVN